MALRYPFTIYTSGFSFRITTHSPGAESMFHKIGVAQIPICRAMPMIWVRSLKKTTTAQVA